MAQFDTYNQPQLIRRFDESYAAELDVPVNGERTEDRITFLADALAWMLEHCWNKGKARCWTPKTALYRFAAISATMRPDLVGMSFSDLAKRLRVDKQVLSYHSVKFSDKAGLRFRPNRRKRR